MNARQAWSTFLRWLTPGARLLLIILTASWAAALAGRLTGVFDFYACFGLFPPSFWRGNVWTAATYWLLPVGALDFLINGFMLLWLSVILERVWSRWEVLLYCWIAGIGAGVAGAAFVPNTPLLLVGSTGVVFGLVAAWARLFGHERILLLGIGEMSVRTAALGMMAFTFALGALSCAGPVLTFTQLCGGIVGWVYLSVRFRMIRGQRARVVANERIGRLEI